MAPTKICPAEILVTIGRQLSTNGIQSLMEELDRVSESPALAAALEHSTSVTVEQKNQLRELHGPGNPIDEAALAEAAAAAEPDIARRQTLIQRLAKMSVAQRVQFAMKGGSETRRTLLPASNNVVHRPLLQ